jgi:hypothetical protein
VYDNVTRIGNFTFDEENLNGKEESRKQECGEEGPGEKSGEEGPGQKGSSERREESCAEKGRTGEEIRSEEGSGQEGSREEDCGEEAPG